VGGWRRLHNLYHILIGNPERKNHLLDLGVDGIILDWILGK